MTHVPRYRPDATTLFGHFDLLAGPHAQLYAYALRRGARQASRVNTMGQALPLALASVVQPQLRTSFARIDKLTGRHVCPPCLKTQPTKRTPWLRMADFAVGQAASCVALGLKIGLLCGAIIYHVAASVVVGLFFGVQAGRDHLGCEAIRAAMQWQHLRAPQTVGAQIGRGVIDFLLGPEPLRSSQPKMSAAAQIVAHIGQVLLSADSQGCAQTARFLGFDAGFMPLCDSVCTLVDALPLTVSATARTIAQPPARKAALARTESLALLLAKHLIHCLANMPEADAADVMRTSARQNIRAIGAHLDAGHTLQAYTLLARIDSRDTQSICRALQEPRHIEAFIKRIQAIDLNAVRQTLRAQKHDFILPYVTETKREALIKHVRDVDWGGVVAFVESLNASDLARAWAARTPSLSTHLRLLQFAQLRDAHLKQNAI